jgi:hypothetical protein
MSFAILFLLLVAASVWWLYSRWSALRDAQAERRASEMLYVFESRSQARGGPPVTPPISASGFGPTLPEGFDARPTSR